MTNPLFASPRGCAPVGTAASHSRTFILLLRLHLPLVCRCVRTVTTIYPNIPLLDAAAASIGRFITSDNHNLKYLGVTGEWWSMMHHDHLHYCVIFQSVLVVIALEPPARRCSLCLQASLRSSATTRGTPQATSSRSSTAWRTPTRREWWSCQCARVVVVPSVALAYCPPLSAPPCDDCPHSLLLPALLLLLLLSQPAAPRHQLLLQAAQRRQLLLVLLLRQQHRATLLPRRNRRRC